MSSNAKFLFDTEFGSANIPKKEKPEEVQAPPLLYTEEDRLRFTEEAIQQGYKDGQQAALSGIEASSSELLNAIAGQLGGISQTHIDGVGNIRKEAASLAIAIAKKLAPALMARQPETEVLQMIEQCLVDLHDEPRIVIRASAQVSSTLQDRIDQLQSISGFQGKIILVPDEALLGSDCRIEWADGGVERNMDKTLEQMETIVERFIRTQQEAG
ncbi:hypothetical protein GUA87_17105 [Sneathiella sp. P13V-1]|uniref:FliH/SctL family protein n=1 Tax=Sneathiella sp. P13V-1 TaxID=2697366 RepID=UPI00187B561E|nr:FliH/SctL family protein [Sneathiella sp. P13V-1]MBE7638578.1 hypothetical protein [Sneathiella sp. P13V-1]